MSDFFLTGEIILLYSTEDKGVFTPPTREREDAFPIYNADKTEYRETYKR